MKIENKNKFKEGDTVYSKANPSEKLIADRYLDRIYFCNYADDSSKSQVPLFERELVGGEFPDDFIRS